MKDYDFDVVKYVKEVPPDGRGIQSGCYYSEVEGITC